ncbi:hypothetical protein EON67_08720 [archaeon]|nr:MAG: hypothetical protein EON67_08720 [archaeon]
MSSASPSAGSVNGSGEAGSALVSTRAGASGLSAGTREEASAISVASMISHAIQDAYATTATGWPASYKIIFKKGDDMRQDQLIIQMIRLMDAQLKRVGLDLRLTPYRVLATSTNAGMMEMVLDSMPVSAVLSQHKNDIMAFFRTHHPQPGADYNIDPDIMDTYVKSCAGYCVITYLLGIGDRHLDNIMLCKDGHLFHVDFGFIFGMDPKPRPAPMRLTAEMIEGMGGPDSNNYHRFKSYCCQAYITLRKSVDLIMSLLNLMRDAGIEALAMSPDVTIAKVRRRRVGCCHVGCRARARAPTPTHTHTHTAVVPLALLPPGCAAARKVPPGRGRRGCRASLLASGRRICGRLLPCLL